MLFLWRGSLARPSRHVAESGQELPLYNIMTFAAPRSKHRDAEGGALRVEEKPLESYIEFIHRDSEPGDLVADLFCGSGVIAEAALITSRRAFASDQDLRCVRAALSRADKVREELAIGRVELRPFAPKQDPTAETIDRVKSGKAPTLPPPRKKAVCAF